MRCAKFRKRVSLCSRDELGAGLPRDLGEHASACPRCLEYADSMRRMVAALRCMAPRSAPPEFVAGVMSALPRRRRFDLSGWVAGRLRWLRAPAPSFSVVVGLGVLAVCVVSAAGIVAISPAWLRMSGTEQGLSNDAINEMVIEHDAYVTTTMPLGDDRGIQMVSHALYR